MKTPIKKLNSQGFSHLLIPVLAIVIIAGIGTYLVTKSHATTIGGGGSWNTMGNYSFAITQDIAPGYVGATANSTPRLDPGTTYRHCVDIRSTDGGSGYVWIAVSKTYNYYWDPSVWKTSATTKVSYSSTTTRKCTTAFTVANTIYGRGVVSNDKAISAHKVHLSYSLWQKY